MYAIEGNPARRVTISKGQTPSTINSFQVKYTGP
jgi:hypothetical protein